MTEENAEPEKQGIFASIVNWLIGLFVFIVIFVIISGMFKSRYERMLESSMRVAFMGICAILFSFPTITNPTEAAQFLLRVYGCVLIFCAFLMQPEPEEIS